MATHYHVRLGTVVALACLLPTFGPAADPKSAPGKPAPRKIDADQHRFNVRSVKDGKWSDPQTWDAGRLPQEGDRVQVRRGTKVMYDVKSPAKIRLLQVVGTLSFARDRDTELNVGILKVQNSDACSEAGFACDFETVNAVGEPHAAPDGPVPALEVGTPDAPIPAQYTARIRLHFLEGMSKDDAPSLACCAARMEFHGAPLSRTWLDLGADVKEGDATVELSEEVTGWRVGDEVLVTGSKHEYSGGRFRQNPDDTSSETRKIMKLAGRTLTLDAPLKYAHTGSGAFRSEVANLSRNVIVESADPAGVRGHALYHRFSQGSIHYARFAHLGKENTLGRYAIHFHLLGDSNRGGSVVGAAIVDSHNRWITIHGTHYLVVRDCVGFKSVGHGYFLEDATETWNVLDRNLGVQAYRGKALPKQVLPFDPNDGAAFWWANGRNTLIRNTSCENDEYGYRFDIQKRSNFNSNLLLPMPDGGEEIVDVRTIPFYRFSDNEAHTEGLYGMAFAGTDGVGPDTRHPHVVQNPKIWEVHYGYRAQLPTMWTENLHIHHAVYGVYRPEFDNHVFKNAIISHTSSEPFNRGLDDESTQHGSIAVDGLTFVGNRYDGIPFIQMSDNNPSGKAESHFRNVKVVERTDNDRRALVDRGGGSVVPPKTPTSVPVYLHDYFGPGRTALVLSTAAQDFSSRSEKFREERPLTGKTSRVAEVQGVKFPELLTPVDDQPPATIITSPARGHVARAPGGKLIVRGTTTDNVATKKVIVNGAAAEDKDYNFHQWEVMLSGVKPGPLVLEAHAEDAAGNVEKRVHRLEIVVE